MCTRILVSHAVGLRWNGLAVFSTARRALLSSFARDEEITWFGARHQLSLAAASASLTVSTPGDVQVVSWPYRPSKPCASTALLYNLHTRYCYSFLFPSRFTLYKYILVRVHLFLVWCDINFTDYVLVYAARIALEYSSRQFRRQFYLLRRNFSFLFLGVASEFS